MSLAAGGGSEEGNGGDDKKRMGKWKIPECGAAVFDAEMEDDEERPPSSSSVENLESLKHSLPDLKEVSSHQRRRESSVRKRNTYLKVRDMELGGRIKKLDQKNRIQRLIHHQLSTASELVRASSMPPPSTLYHDDDDDDEEEKKPKKRG